MPEPYRSQAGPSQEHAMVGYVPWVSLVCVSSLDMGHLPPGKLLSREHSARPLHEVESRGEHTAPLKDLLSDGWIFSRVRACLGLMFDNYYMLIEVCLLYFTGLFVFHCFEDPHLGVDCGASWLDRSLPRSRSSGECCSATDSAQNVSVSSIRTSVLNYKHFYKPDE